MERSETQSMRKQKKEEGMESLEENDYQKEKSQSENSKAIHKVEDGYRDEHFGQEVAEVQLDRSKEDKP